MGRLLYQAAAKYGSRWVSFIDRLPTSDDADLRGKVRAQESSGTIRDVDWNWVNSADAWLVNGFVFWRPCNKKEATTPTGD